MKKWFVVDEGGDTMPRVVDLETLAEANKDDPGLVYWMENAKLADQFSDGGACAEFTLTRVR